MYYLASVNCILEMCNFMILLHVCTGEAIATVFLLSTCIPGFFLPACPQAASDLLLVCAVSLNFLEFYINGLIIQNVLLSDFFCSAWWFWDPCILLDAQWLVLYCPGLVHYMAVWKLVSPLTSWWRFRLSSVFGVKNKDTKDIHVLIISLEKVPGVRIAGP